MPEQFQVFSTGDIQDYGRQLGTHVANGFEIVNCGMSMGTLGPVWWAIMKKESK